MLLCRPGKPGTFVLPCVLLLTTFSLVSCSRHRSALPPPTDSRERNERVFQTNEEAIKAGIYEEFVDSMALKSGAAGRAVSTPGAQAQGELAPDVVMGYRVQLGAFNDQISAETLAARVRQQTGNRHAVYVRYYAPMWKVHAGNCRTQEEAERLRREFQGAGYPDAWIVNVGIQR